MRFANVTDKQAALDDTQAEPQVAKKTPTLFPSLRQKHTLHVCAPKSRIGRSNETLVVTSEVENRKETKHTVPIEDIDSVVIHGHGQITTQAIHLCSYHGVAVQWMSFSGRFAAGTAASPGRVQQRIRQYAALQDEPTRLRLARDLVHAKVEMQLRYLLRCTRGGKSNRTATSAEIDTIRSSLRGINRAESASSLLGYEGTAASAYFASLPAILSINIQPEMVPKGRSKHPVGRSKKCFKSYP